MQKKRATGIAAAFAVTLLLLAAGTSGQIAPLENRDAALAGADRLLEVQRGSGAFPWNVEQAGEFQNVQGNTAIALLDAYTLSLDAAYLEGAKANRDWIATWMNDTQEGRPSAPNVYFLAKYALLSQELEDLDLAREALARSLTFYENATALAEFILNARVNQGHTNLGVWDVAHYVRAAHDIGWSNASAEFAAVLAAQTTEDAIVNAFDESANWYELGLSGLLFGLSEADFLGYQDILGEAQDALLATQCGDDDGNLTGSFPRTWQGNSECGHLQSTAYAVIGLTHTLDVLGAAQDGCDFLRDAQEADGGWVSGTAQFANVISEATQALAACVVPVHNGVLSYADPLVGELPLL